MHQRFQDCSNKSPFVKMMIRVMPNYLGKGSDKKIHDLLAAACAVDLSVGTFVPVELYREKGKWGSRKTNKPNCEIIIDYNKEKFLNMLLGE
jgi:pyrimidine-specific ribonucleoside hydrolase